MTRPAECSIHAYLDGSRYTLVVTGELDLISAPVLESAARAVDSNGARELVLDLGGLDFMDSSGIRALLVVKSVCDEFGCEFWVLPVGESQVERLFEVSGIKGRLPTRQREGPPSGEPTVLWPPPEQSAPSATAAPSH